MILTIIKSKAYSTKKFKKIPAYLSQLGYSNRRMLD